MSKRMNMHFSTRLSFVILLVLLIGTNILSVGCSLSSGALPQLPPTPTGSFAITQPTGALATAFVGSSYVQPITTSLSGAVPRGTGPLTSCLVVNGILPPGLMIGVDPADPRRCLISGIATSTSIPAGCTAGGAAGALYSCTFTVRATDSSIPSLSDTEVFSISVLAGFSITTPAVEDAIAGRAWTKTINTNVGLPNAQGTPQGTAPLTSCTISNTDSVGNPLTLPPGMSAGMTNIARGTSTDGRANAACIVMFTPPAGTSGTFMFRVITVDSSANMRDAVYTVTVRNEWAVTPFSVVDGIVNRPYSKTFMLMTNLSNNANDVGQAAEFGNGPLDSTNLAAANCGGRFASLPAGITASCVLDPGGTSLTVTLSGTPTATGASMSTVNLPDSVIPDSNQPCPDTVNMPGMQCPSATPVVAASPKMSGFGFQIRSEFTITPFTVVDGVVNRPYSKTFQVMTDLANNPDPDETFSLPPSPASAESGNGPITACVFGNLPAGITATSCTVDAGGTSVTVTLSGTPTATGTVASTLMLTDTNILQSGATVVAGAAVTANFNFAIRNEFTITSPVVVEDGVVGRTYTKTFQVTTDLSNNPVASEVGSAENGNGPITTCVFSGLPAGISASSCTVDAGGTSVTVTLSGTPTAAGTVSSMVSLTDTDILQSGATVVAGKAVTSNFNFTIRPEFTFVTTTVVDAITGRAYSKHLTTDLLAAAGPSDINQPESGNGPPVTCTATVDGNALPFGGFSVSAAETDGCRISTGAGTVTLAAGPHMLMVTAMDTPIGTVVPAGSVSTTYTLTVRPEFMVTAFTVEDAVVNRTYDKTFTISTNLSNNTVPTEVGSGENGNGPIASCMITGLPTGISLTSCTPDASGTSVTAVFSGTPTATGTVSSTVTLMDTDVLQTGATVVGASSVTFNFNFTVRPEFTFLTTTVVDGVAGQGYTKLVETDLLDTAGGSDVGQMENGNGPLVACGISPTNSGFGAMFTDGTTGITLMVTPATAPPAGIPAAPGSCLLTATIPGTVTAGQNVSFFIQATDSPIGSTIVPSGTVVSGMFTLTVRDPIKIDLAGSFCNFDAAGNAGAGTFCPVAVVNRTYTNTLVQQAATGGDPPVTWATQNGTATSLNTGNAACNNLTINSGTGAITSTPSPTTAGTCTFTATLSDSGIMQATQAAHGATPAGTMLTVVPVGSDSQTLSFDVRPEMTVVNAPPSLPGGLKGSFYTASLAVVNGLSGLPGMTTGPVGLPAIVEWSVVDGAFFVGGTGVAGTPCEGLSFFDNDGTTANQGATVNGTPVNPGTCGPFTVQVTDNGNAPGGFPAVFVPNGSITQMFSIEINDSIGFVSNLAPFVRVIRTDTDTATPFIYPLTIPGSPQGVTVSPSDPLIAWVAGGTTPFVESFCTRVQLPECPVAFAPPVPTTGTPSVGPLGAPTDVAIANSPTFSPGITVGAIADPVAGTVFFFQAQRSPVFPFNQVGASTGYPGARNLSIRPQSDFVWVTAFPSDTIAEIDMVNSFTITGTVTIGGGALEDVAVSPDGRFAYVADSANARVHVIGADPTNPATYRFCIASTPAAGNPGGLFAGAVPRQIAFAPDGRFAYVTDAANNVVAAVDPATLVGAGPGCAGSVLVTNNSIALSGGTTPQGIALTDDSRKAFVANNGNNSVTSIDTDATPSGTFQQPLTNFNGAGNFVAPFGVATMSDPHLHILNPLPKGITGVAYDFFIVATGGTRPYTFFNDTPLPAGLMMDAAGHITGVPTAAGMTTVTFRVVDTSIPQQTDTRMVTMTISDAANLLPATVVDAVTARTYTNNIATGLPFLVSNPGGNAGSLNTGDADCAGLSVNATGTISGTATSAADGVCNFTVELRDAMNNLVASQPYSLTIRQEYDVTAFTVVDGIINRPYSNTFTISTNLSNSGNDTGQAGEFGNGPVTACAFSNLPAGISAMSCTVAGGGTSVTAVLSGTPTVAGSFMSTVTLTDSDEPSGNGGTAVPKNMRSFTFGFDVRNDYSITSAAPVLGTAFNGQPYNAMFTVTTDLSVGASDVGQFASEVGNGPIATCMVTGALPAGVMVTGCTTGATSAMVTLNGTPSIAGPFPAMFPLMINIVDTNIGTVVAGAVRQQAFVLTVDKTGTTTAITSDTPDPSVFGQNYTVNVSVASTGGTTSNPSGTVTVSDGTNSCPVTLTVANPSTGSCMLPSTAVGSFNLTATYPGDGNFYGSDNTGTPEPHMVSKADTTTTINSDNPDPSAVNTAVTVNATVAAIAPGAGTPSGTVTVTTDANGTDTCTITLSGGTGSCMITLTTSGPQNLAATYNGDTGFNASGVGTSTAGTAAHTVKALVLATFTLADGSVSTATVARTYSVDIPFTGSGATGCSDGGTLPAGLSVALVGSVCQITGNPTATFSGMVTITVTDGVTPDSQMSALTINAALTIAQDTGMNNVETLSPDAVSQQSYTKMFTATGGQPMYAFAEKTGAALSNDTDCAGLTFTGTTTGSLGSTPTAAGPFPITCTFTIQATDTDTFSIVNGVPTASPTSPKATYDLALTLNITDPLAITTTTAINALRNSAYNPTGSPAGQTLATTGGTGAGYTWSITGAALGTLFTASGMNFVGVAATPCEGLTLDGTGPSGTTGLIHGTPVNAGTCGPFNVTVTDPGNGPIGSRMVTQALSIVVLNTFTYVADTANNQVNVVNTTSDADTGSPISLTSIGANRGPNSIAVRRDGTRAYVTLETSSQLAVIDTTSNALSGSAVDLSAVATCTGPRGIAIGSAGNAKDRAYIACTNDSVAIFDVSGASPSFLRTITISGIGGAGQEPFGIDVSPDGSRVFIAVGSTQSVFSIATNANVASESVTETATVLPASASTRHALFSADGTRVYLTDVGLNQVHTVVAATPASGTTTNIRLFTGLAPLRLTRDPDTGRVFVGMSGTGQLDPDSGGTGTTTGFAMPIEANATTATNEITVGLNNATRNNGTTTITFTSQPFSIGDIISVFGMSDSTFDGIYTVQSAPTNSFTYSQPGRGNVNNQENATIVLLFRAGSTAVNGLTTPATNSKVYLGITGNLARRNDTSNFNSAGADIALTGTATVTPQGVASIPIPKP